MAKHPQVRVKAPEWEPFGRIRVDRELAPLLRELWRRGYLTVMSCQDYGDGTAWILFGTMHADDSDGLVARMTQFGAQMTARPGEREQDGDEDGDEQQAGDGHRATGPGQALNKHGIPVR